MMGIFQYLATEFRQRKPDRYTNECAGDEVEITDELCEISDYPRMIFNNEIAIAIGTSGIQDVIDSLSDLVYILSDSDPSTLDICAIAYGTLEGDPDLGEEVYFKESGRLVRGYWTEYPKHARPRYFADRLIPLTDQSAAHPQFISYARFE